MKQARLDIEARRLSAEEQELKSKLDRIRIEIKRQQQFKMQRREELEARREEQKIEGLKLAEVPIDSQLIQAILEPYDAEIKRLERKAKNLQAQLPDLTKESQKQKGLGL